MAHEIVAACRNLSDAEPGVAPNQTLQIAQLDNLQIILADDRAQKLGIAPHDVGGNIELAVSDEPGLLTQLMVGRSNGQLC